MNTEKKPNFKRKLNLLVIFRSFNMKKIVGKNGTEVYSNEKKQQVFIKFFFCVFFLNPYLANGSCLNYIEILFFLYLFVSLFNICFSWLSMPVFLIVCFLFMIIIGVIRIYATRFHGKIQRACFKATLQKNVFKKYK